MGSQPRNLLFVSHANPEDNQFSLWLSLQLAKEGFPVWCDLTRLLGGEDFWNEIEDALRIQAVKLIYVLSRASNHKPGPLKELQLALTVSNRYGLNDFVVPLRVDDIPYSEINIQLGRLNVIDFHQGWARGLRSLLDKLNLDGVEKDPRFSPESVAAWWRGIESTEADVTESTEEHLSNWFEIVQLPEFIHVHSHTGPPGKFIESQGFSYPLRRHHEHLVSFASAEDLRDKMPNGVSICASYSVSMDNFIEGVCQPINLDRRTAHNIVVDLLRQGWEKLIESLGMSKHLLSGRRVAAFLTDGQNHKNRVSIPLHYGGSRSRTLVGYRSRPDGKGGKRRRFWHFAIESRPMLHPYVGYKLVPHLLFSDDGRNIWKSSGRQHKARRGEARNWWNAHWRDRTLGLVMWLADNRQQINIPLGSKALVQVQIRPISFNSPVSYSDPGSGRDTVWEASDSVELANEEDDC